MSKQVLGRGLGNLLGGKNSAQKPEMSTQNNTEPNIPSNAGIRVLLGGASEKDGNGILSKNVQIPTGNETKTDSVQVTRSSIPEVEAESLQKVQKYSKNLIVWALFIADFLLVLLSAFLVFRSPSKLSIFEAIVIICAVLFGSILASVGYVQRKKAKINHQNLKNLKDNTSNLKGKC